MQNVVPKNVSELLLFSDSLVALGWLNGYVIKLEKQNKIGTFVKNRLTKIVSLCDEFPVKFMFIDGISNPGDCISRPVSLKLLKRKNYFYGPKFLTEYDEVVSSENILRVLVPNPRFSSDDPKVTSFVSKNRIVNSDHLISLDRFSKFSKFLRIYGRIFEFINKLKRKHRARDEFKYSHLVEHDTYKASLTYMILTEQWKQFNDIFSYFENTNVPVKNIPNLVLQLNLFLDSKGLLRVGSKMMKTRKSYFPLLLPKSSVLTNLIITNTHERLSHAGIYSVLAELRRQFWVPCVFSVVKRILKVCTHCKRYNARTIKLNQGMYRDFRVSPSEIPFSNVFLDHAGPFHIRKGSENTKVYLLVISCLYTRAVNLVLSIDLTVEEFLRSLSMHSFEYGVPLRVISDLGSQIVSGAEIIRKFLSDDDSNEYFREHGSKVVSFEQFYKGKKELGGLIESCVKLTKRLLSGSIGRNILSYREFEYFVAQTKHLVNRRPIAFKSSLRDTSSSELPEPITPELLIHGYNLISINLMPALQSVEDPEFGPDYDPTGSLRSMHEKLKRVRSRLLNSYYKEFIPQLIHQATDNGKRYKPVNHNKLEVGDLVLIGDEMTKRTNLQMARVLAVETNRLGEVTGVTLKKGATGEIVKRHTESLIPLLNDINVRSAPKPKKAPNPGETIVSGRSRKQRTAAVRANELNRKILNNVDI